MTNNGRLLNFDPRHGLPSASIMYRLKQCSGSLALSNWVKRHGYFVPQNPDAKAGSLIHQALAAEMLAKSAQDFDAKLTELTEAQRETAYACAQLRDGLITEWMAERDDSKPDDYSLYVERRLWYRIEDKPIFSAQADLFALDRLGHRALIIDYKTGRLEAQAAADNLQLRTEVVLLKHALPELGQVQGVIIEPLVSWESEHVRYLTYDDFDQAEREILAIVDAATWNDKTRNAGPWCTYCPGRVYCKEAANYIQQIPNFPASDVALSQTGDLQAQFDSEIMFRDLPRGEKGAILWRRVKIAEKLLEAITQTYEQILSKEPDALPGFVLPEVGRARRRITDPAKLKAALAEILSGDEIDGCAEYSLAQIAKHYRIKAEVSESIAKKLIADLTRDITTITHDKAFIRPLTKAEKTAAGEQT